MAKQFQAVIGANYGDEGKGREVDRIVKGMANPLVVRHNSGAQAGHTVVINDKRHIHSHFGSGTLRGAPTLLAHRFVVNPLVFNREWDELVSKGVKPVVYVDEGCAVSSPLDVMLNQRVEIFRGFDRHGSCGVGFGETIMRHLPGNGPHTLVSGMKDFSEFPVSNLEDWYLAQCRDRGLSNDVGEPDPLHDAHMAVLDDVFNWKLWQEELDLFSSRVTIIERPDALLGNHDVVFEGAQGLMLHQDHEYAPHVTWCRTGIEDVTEFLRNYDLASSELHVSYCTRPYLTRHGRGPLPLELVREPFPGIVDETNVQNDWQGSIRYALLNERVMADEITKDIERSDVNGSTSAFSWRLALSCADQVPEFDENMFVSLRPSTIGFGPDSSDTTFEQ